MTLCWFTKTNGKKACLLICNLVLLDYSKPELGYFFENDEGILIKFGVYMLMLRDYSQEKLTYRL